MKKKFLFALLVTLTGLMLMSTSVFALTDGDWEFQLLDNEVTITGYLGTDTDIVIPETIYGATVTNLKLPREKDFGKAKSITFPKTLKKIDKFLNQFWNGDEALEQVYIPEGIEVIGESAFEGCDKLTDITLPSTIIEIERAAFKDCTGLTKIDFPQNLKKIGGSAFDSSGLTNVDLSHLTDIELPTYVFCNCKSLETVKLPAGLNTIMSYCFKECDALTDIQIPNSVTKIENWAFIGCDKLENVILPTSLKVIGGDAFRECNSLKEMVIPYGVEKISSSAFAHCENLKSLYIPDTVTNLNKYIIFDSPNCIVYCNADSKAAEVCKNNKISYLTDKSVNSGITVLYNGTRVSFHSYDQNPELINSRTLVPLRSIFEAMGADVEWIGETSTVIATRNGVKITLQIGSNNVVKNNENITIDTPPMLLNSRTMVPVRVIAEAFGADVEWHNAGRTVIITE